MPGLFSKAEGKDLPWLYCRIFIGRFWFWSVFTDTLCLPHLLSPFWPEIWQWCSFSWPVQYGLLVANTLNFSLVGNLDVMTFSFRGNKPHPSDLICMRNSVTFFFDPSPWEVEYRPRFSWTNLCSCRLLSGVGTFLIVSLLLFFLPLNSISGRPDIWEGLFRWSKLN